MSVRLCVTLCICFSELNECIFFAVSVRQSVKIFRLRRCIYSKVGGVDVTLIEGEQIIK